jgi:hypothetical protein
MWTCPRCRTALAAAAYPSKVGLETRGTLPVHRCPTCGGLAVEVRHNVPLLDALAKDVAPTVDADAPVPQHVGETAPAPCPKCGGPTARFGYLGTNRVFLDRCDRCLVLWHDGDELLVTVTLHAKTNRIRATRDRTRDEATRMLNMIAWGTRN